MVPNKEVRSERKGVVDVSVDADGRQTVLSTGFTYPESVDFAEGDFDQKGDFIPRYWGWGRSDGVIWDYAKGPTELIEPLNKKPVIKLVHSSMLDDRAHMLAEDAHSLKP